MGILSRTRWDEFVEVFNDLEKFADLTAVADKLGLNYDTVRHTAAFIRREGFPSLVARVGKAGAKREVGAEHRVIETVPDSYEEPIHDLLDRVFTATERFASHHDQKACIDVRINVDGPFGVVGLPDNHLNNIGTQTRRAFEDAALIAEHPNLFCVAVGDWIDNFIVGRLERERRKDVMTHADSWRILEHYFEIIAPKVVGAISGNHMDWTTDMGGVDYMKKLFVEKGLGPVFDSDELRVRLKTKNGKEFIHFLRHKFPGHSKYNSMHGILVWMLERWQGEDVFWGGHIHVAAHTELEKRWMGESRIVHGVQLAAYKTIDGYSTREGFRQNQPFIAPITIHDPDLDRTTFFADMREGIIYLDAIRRARGYK